MRPWRIWACLLTFRFINALLCQTFFQPDEFYQSLEVAHKLVFGYGWTTWEWRPENAIRSPLVPLLYVPAYWLVKVSGFEHTAALIWAPKVVQAGVAASIDYFSVRLAKTLHGHEEIVPVALFVTLSSFFNAGVAVRSFSNSIETGLTAAALTYWPWWNGSSQLSLILASLACIIRPTNALIWMPLAIPKLAARGYSRTELIHTATISAVAATVLCCFIDSWFYGKLTFSPLNFLRTNVFNSISLFYGANAWHYYITQGLPFTTLGLLPFVLQGVVYDCGGIARYTFGSARAACFFTCLALSLISHKEFRFIQPLLPMLHAIAAVRLFNQANHVKNINFRRSVFAKNILAKHARLILAINAPAAMAFICMHMRAQVDVVKYLHTAPNVHSIGFLMPCHSTPWQSHIHRSDLDLTAHHSGYGGRLWAISCEPPLNRQAEVAYFSEDDLLYNDTFAFVAARFPSIVDLAFPPSAFTLQISRGEGHGMATYQWPSHLVIFDELLHRMQTKGERTIRSLLHSKGYIESKRFWNSLIHEDPRRSGDIVVLTHDSVNVL